MWTYKAMTFSVKLFPQGYSNIQTGMALLQPTMDYSTNLAGMQYSMMLCRPLRLVSPRPCHESPTQLSLIILNFAMTQRQEEVLASVCLTWTMSCRNILFETCKYCEAVQCRLKQGLYGILGCVHFAQPLVAYCILWLIGFYRQHQNINAL